MRSCSSSAERTPYPIGIARPAIDGIQFRPRDFEGYPKLNERLDAPQQRPYVLTAWRRGDGIGATQLDIGCSPAQGPAEINDSTGREQGTQRPLRFLLDFFPTGFGNGRAITKQMVLHFLT